MYELNKLQNAQRIDKDNNILFRTEHDLFLLP